MEQGELGLGAPLDGVSFTGAPFTGAAFDRARLEAAAADVLAHPRFDAVLPLFCGRVVEAFEGHWLANRLMGDASRFALTALAFALEHGRLTGRHPEGATVSAMADALARRKLASRRSVQATVAFLRFAGALEPAPGAPTRRGKPLRPTEAMRAGARRWVEANVDGVGALVPLPVPAAALVARPGFLDAYFARLAAPYLEHGFILYDGLPEIEAMMACSGGYLAILEVARRAAPDGTGAVTAEAPHGALARRAHVSRSQARSVMAMAEARAWLTPSDRGGRRLVLSPGFHDACRRWVAREIAWGADLALGAFESVA